ncbi:polyribonucleotide nucleotidyltransferase [bacterium]|nr:polyribonucleotide nucleotidyltransferase [bacterium]
MESTAVEREIGGRPLIIETGWLAGQANASVVLKEGESVVLVTVCSSPETREDIDFLPLTCEFEERLYAVGKIPGGFFKREGRPSERAITYARMMDRPIRPLFPKGLRNEVQIIAIPLCADPLNPPDILAVLGASAALTLSDIPFNGPIGVVRVSKENGNFIINPPSLAVLEKKFNLVVAGTRERIVMIDFEGSEPSEEEIVSAIEFAQPYIQALIDMQLELREKCGKNKSDAYTILSYSDEIKSAVLNYEKELWEAIFIEDKKEREKAMKEAEEKIKEELSANYPEQVKEIPLAIEAVEEEIVRREILENGRRPDGRKPEDIREIECQVGLLPRVHGSALFRRGQTQVLTTATLGALEEVQRLEGILEEESKRFMHQYNFPPFSTGEVRPLRAPTRREVGHGFLAERALEQVIPPEKEFPYAIRLVSEVLESNGSTSMASVCASSMALMDAGVPVRKAVAGISIGMVSEGEKFVLLTDIQGIEDRFGDMDFKVAGTRDGITAIQLDVKNEGLTSEMISATLQRAKEVRHYILDKMDATISAPRETISPYAPLVLSITIPTDKIALVIGSGGQTIRKIVAETDAKIDIQDDGTVYITAPSIEKGEAARDKILGIVSEIKPGEVYTGKVKSISPSGAVVEILPGKEAFLHISQISTRPIKKVEEVLQVGDEILVKVESVEPSGRITLTRKKLFLPVGQKPVGRRPQRSNPPKRRPSSNRE